MLLWCTSCSCERGHSGISAIHSAKAWERNVARFIRDLKKTGVKVATGVAR